MLTDNAGKAERPVSVPDVLSQ